MPFARGGAVGVEGARGSADRSFDMRRSCHAREAGAEASCRRFPRASRVRALASSPHATDPGRSERLPARRACSLRRRPPPRSVSWPSTSAACFAWVAVCPETEAGFGVPRETLQLVGDRGGPADDRHGDGPRPHGGDGGLGPGAGWTSLTDAWPLRLRPEARIAELRSVRGEAVRRRGYGHRTAPRGHRTLRPGPGASGIPGCRWPTRRCWPIAAGAPGFCAACGRGGGRWNGGGSFRERTDGRSRAKPNRRQTRPGNRGRSPGSRSCGGGP